MQGDVEGADPDFHRPWRVSVVVAVAAGDVDADGRDIAGALVDRGLALAYRDFSKAYVENEIRAAKARYGMWQGRFSPPWDWRRE